MMRAQHTMAASDIFAAYDTKKITGKGNIKVTYKAGNKKLLIIKVFMYFIGLVINDLVAGHIFHFPTKTVSNLTFNKVQGELFKKCYQTGKFDKIDYLMSNFTLYIPIFRYFYRGKTRSARVILDDRHKDIMAEKINAGFKYN